MRDSAAFRVGRLRIPLQPALLALLAALYIVGLLINRSPTSPPLLSRFSTAATRSITLSVSGRSVVLSKAGSTWSLMLSGKLYPASSQRVASLLASLARLRVSRVASTHRGDWPQFSLDAQHAASLVVDESGGRRIQLFVGSEDSGGGMYARLPGESRVLQVSPSIAAQVVAPPNYWSDLRILPAGLTTASLVAISVQASRFVVGGTSISEHYLLDAGVQGGQTQWVAGGRSVPALDQQKVLAMESELIGLSGDEFASGESEAEAGFARPTATIVLSDESGQSMTLFVGNRSGSRFYVKRADRPYVYLVNEYSLQRAIPTLESLMAVRSRTTG
ncbi:MAG TPA: DUF4340 domain-containing protein [Spirochaetia bacterium]|nr:DUF4340 domain-containing protein [Spirochaetia bacterium]